MRGAVARSADRVYDSLDPDQRVLLRSLLLRLVTPSADGDVVRCRLDASVLRGDAPPSSSSTGSSQARLVTAEADSVELAHEALARAWPRLRGWLEEGTEGQRVLRHLATAATRLGVARAPRERAVPGRSPRDGDRTDAVSRRPVDIDRDRVPRPVTGTANCAPSTRSRRAPGSNDNAPDDFASHWRGRPVVLAFAVVAGLVAVDRGRRADASRADAELAALVNQSLALRGTSRSAAALLAVEAVRRAPADARARSALLGLVHRGARVPGTPLPAGPRAGGRHAAAGHRSCRRQRRDEAWGCSMSPRVTRSCRSRCPTTAVGIHDLAVSRDAAVGGRARGVTPGRAQIVVHDIGSGARVAAPIEVDGNTGRFAISADGAEVAFSAAGSGAVDVFDVASGERLGGAPPVDEPAGPWDRDIGAVGFAPDGDLVVGSAGGPLRILDGSTLVVRATLDVAAAVSQPIRRHRHGRPGRRGWTRGDGGRRRRQRSRPVDGGPTRHESGARAAPSPPTRAPSACTAGVATASSKSVTARPGDRPGSDSTPSSGSSPPSRRRRTGRW